MRNELIDILINRIESTEVITNTRIKYIIKLISQINRKRMFSSQKLLGKQESHMEKKFGLYFHAYTTVSSIWIKDINVKYETLRD